MAKIDLNNLIRPKEVNSPDTKVSDQVIDVQSVYTDLHLDLQIAKNIGLGLNTSESKDILVDYDILAIRNSIKNIFTTKKGEKILAPEFGCNLEQYLFEPINDIYGRLIAEDILQTIEKFEPRIEIEKINISAIPDDNMYNIEIRYKFKQIKKQSMFNIIALQGGELLFQDNY
jgi:phage baseplate assembly protein W